MRLPFRFRCDDSPYRLPTLRSGDVLDLRQARLLAQRIRWTAGYAVHATRRQHSSIFYELIVEDLSSGEWFMVQSGDDWDKGIRHPAIELDTPPH